MKKKYIELLLKRCLNSKKGDILFLNYNKVNKDIIEIINEVAYDIGIKEIYYDERDLYYTHDILKNSNIKEIENNSYFNSSIWDEYAKKDALFLMLSTEMPGVMDDISDEKITLSSKIIRNTKPVYKKKQLDGSLSWCIALMPNKIWADKLFPNNDNSLELFWDYIFKLCMIAENNNPIKMWNNFLTSQKNITNKLNNLHIEKLYYENNMGTNLEIGLLDNGIWRSAGEDECINNMPSYEVFTSPNKDMTNGIVYSSRPLYYGGKLIDNFKIEFKDGKVINYDAKVGKDVLEEIINSDEYSSYLGEVALVNYDSPISNTNMVFGTTLYDENASCHLALGMGFNDCVKDYQKYNQEELINMGLNNSKNHVDFMVGTKDLNIKALTKDGIIYIMKDGNIVI